MLLSTLHFSFKTLSTPVVPCSLSFSPTQHEGGDGAVLLLLVSGLDNCQALVCTPSFDGPCALAAGNCHVLIGLGQTFSSTVTPSMVAFVNPVTSSVLRGCHGYRGYNVQPEQITAHLPYAPKPLTPLT